MEPKSRREIFIQILQPIPKIRPNSSTILLIEIDNLPNWKTSQH
jgi:hypothetical protein